MLKIPIKSGPEILSASEISRGPSEATGDPDKNAGNRPFPLPVIPAKAGTHKSLFVTPYPIFIGSRIRGNDNFITEVIYAKINGIKQ